MVEHVVQREKVQALLGAELAGLPPEIAARFPIQRYLGHYASVQHYGRYGWVPTAAASDCREIESHWGQQSIERYHRAVLLTLIGEFDETATTRAYPPQVRASFESYLRGVLAQMERPMDHYYLHGNDRFLKDLAVCRHKLVPCGAQLVDVRSGLARRLIFQQQPGRMLELLSYVSLALGGIKPLCEMHMDPRLVLEFSKTGWERCYLRIAAWLAVNPDTRGVFGVSWWFDPALAKVSPRLNFLRDLPVEGGARLFFAGAGGANVGNALNNSKERRDAYERGTYRPSDWCLIWGRKDLLAWAASRTGGLVAQAS